MQQAGKEFGVRFVLNGSILSSGDKLRITAQLTDTLSGKQLWTETLYHELGDLLANLDGAAGTFGDGIAQVMSVVVNREVERRKSSPTYAELMIRADIMGWDSVKREHLDKMESLFRQAVALEPPDKRGAKLGLAATLAMILGANYITEESAREKAWTEARDLVSRAKAIGPDTWGTNFVTYRYARDHGDPLGARVALETWIAREPTNWYPQTHMGYLLLRTGEPQKALEILTKVNADATRTDPNRPFEFVISSMAGVYMHLGDNDASLKWAIKAAQMFPTRYTYWDLALAYTLIGEDARAREAVANLLQLDPEFKISTHPDKPRPGDSAAFREFWEKKEVPSLRKAGLPE